MSALGWVAVIVTTTICLLFLMAFGFVLIGVARANREDDATFFHGEDDR